MRFGARVFATIGIVLILPPLLLLRADDTAKPAAEAKVDKAVQSRAVPGPVAKGKLAATPAAALPASGPSSKTANSVTPRVEWFLGYSYVRAIPTDPNNRLAWLNGGSTSVAFNVNRYLGIVADFGGYRSNELALTNTTPYPVVNASGNIFTYMAGPRISYRRNERITPFAQVLFGGGYAGAVPIPGCSGSPGCTPLLAENTFTMTAGGGLDVNLTRHFALRVIQAEYMWSRFWNPSSPTGDRAFQNDMRLSAGLVFRFGGGHRPAPLPPPPPPPPPVAACSADKGMVYAGSGEMVTVRAQANSPNNNPLTYTWTATGGAVAGSGPEVQWNSSGVAPGSYTVRARVDDGRGGTTECTADVRVEPRPNRVPIMACSADRHSINIGERVQITATASDPDNDPLTYSWRTTGGQIVGSGASVSFDSSGLAAGRNTVTGHVDDGRGGTADCTVDFDLQIAQAAVITELEAKLALHSIYFPTAQPTAVHPEGGLMESQQGILNTLASDFKKYLELKPDARLTLVGHADPRGSVEFNKALTDRRVERSKKFLVEHGVPSDRIETQSLGKQDLLTSAQIRTQMESNPDLTPEDRRRLLGPDFRGIVLAQNRRVDIVLSGTGQQSVRQYPFNAKDAHTLLDDKQLVH